MGRQSRRKRQRRQQQQSRRRQPRSRPQPQAESRTSVSESEAGDVDPGLLARVRALLAKAESTSYPDEAEAFTAKAQELMSRYRIDRALLDDRQEAPGRRTVSVDAPYANAKSLLLSYIAMANGCRAIWMNREQESIVFGAPAELVLIETLFTSLLVQATRACAAAGSQPDPSGRSRTRSFRQSFLVSFATRIGERLREREAAVHADLSEEERSRALPVLARRSSELEDYLEEQFPRLRYRTIGCSNGQGWSAGRSAADRADLATPLRAS